ncbi:hypothetical protein [Arthrobacter sp. zg-Y1143]|uniref:hypothetical protein n=1 Tax=Arthrobacter sp. zg-Y1143 TaxID=3049065 RepID=UPI0024C440BA|nr:hypothetical protein [Arthrobacter sp. zg-Y1143]MDK1327245.1 hypothetical protein [Arthrobacter sp. zg-Y1143]
MEFLSALVLVFFLAAGFAALLTATVRAVRTDGTGHLPPFTTEGSDDVPPASGFDAVRGYQQLYGHRH